MKNLFLELNLQDVELVDMNESIGIEGGILKVNKIVKSVNYFSREPVQCLLITFPYSYFDKFGTGRTDEAECCFGDKFAGILPVAFTPLRYNFISDALLFHLVVGNLTVSWGLPDKSRDSKLERWKTPLGNIPYICVSESPRFVN
ncbi:hypothetical protein H5410_000542 [Solanum commersonii]|uniref:Uncharacterized protein n=1 Tax=Solanum commersonii TaxID=4109 RepID=A0A9J6AWS9_SOLCO|nr:hypothetical protein H5410_000542 [Solanum commersonii]